jgi:hypothetical protein
MRNLKSLAVVIVVVASACSTQKYYWIHPEKDAQQFDEDNAYCLAQTRGARAIARMPEYQGGQAGTFSSGWSTVSTVRTTELQQTIHQECMTDKGWERQAE